MYKLQKYDMKGKMFPIFAGRGQVLLHSEEIGDFIIDFLNEQCKGKTSSITLSTSTELLFTISSFFCVSFPNRAVSVKPVGAADKLL